MTLLAVDPSVRSPGVALFEGGALVAAARLTVKHGDVCDGRRWYEAASAIRSWADERRSFGGLDIVFERPQIYRAAKSKGDPNDLIGLAGVAMAVVGLYGSILASVSSPTPAEWIGQLPKATKGSAKESPRAKRILSRLSPEELKLVPDQHDAIDAVGLGLWRLGRLEPVRKFSNGRDKRGGR